jgi:hypothetical protein
MLVSAVLLFFSSVISKTTKLGSCMDTTTIACPHEGVKPVNRAPPTTICVSVSDVKMTTGVVI